MTDTPPMSATKDCYCEIEAPRFEQWWCPEHGYVTLQAYMEADGAVQESP